MGLSIVDVDEKIIEIRGTRVLLDSDVAFLYGVETREVNQAVKNNPDKFLKGYVIPLNDSEIRNLRSKNLIANTNANMSRVPPKAFTEKGLYMLATILKSPQATQATLSIVETFVRIRELTRVIGKSATVTEKEEKEELMQKGGEIISSILGDSLNVSETETTFEINLAVMNFKHTVKKNK